MATSDHVLLVAARGRRRQRAGSTSPPTPGGTPPEDLNQSTEVRQSPETLASAITMVRPLITKRGGAPGGPARGSAVMHGYVVRVRQSGDFADLGNLHGWRLACGRPVAPRGATGDLRIDAWSGAERRGLCGLGRGGEERQPRALGAGCCAGIQALVPAMDADRGRGWSRAEVAGSTGRGVAPVRVFAPAALLLGRAGVVRAAGHAWPAARSTTPARRVTGWPRAIVGSAGPGRLGGAHPWRRRSRWRRAW